MLQCLYNVKRTSRYTHVHESHAGNESSVLFVILVFLDLVLQGLFLEPDTYTAVMRIIQRDCRVCHPWTLFIVTFVLWL